MNREAVARELICVARLLAGATGKGSLSFNGSEWFVRWTSAWPDARNGGEHLDRELRDKVDEVQRDISQLTGAQFTEVKPVGYSCMGQAGLVGEVVFKEIRAPRTDVSDFVGEFIDHMRRLGYRAK